jgi:hypothetical protein
VSEMTPEGVTSAKQFLEETLFAILGVRGLGEYAWTTRQMDPEMMGLEPGQAASAIVQRIRFGTDPSEAGQKARQAYLDQFPGMDTFLTNGTFAGTDPEKQYMVTRKAMQESVSRYGASDRFASKEYIAQALLNNVSADEWSSRLSDAAVAAATVDQNTRNSLAKFYGVNDQDLYSFYLDTQSTEEMLKQRYVSAVVGGTAERYGLSTVDKATAEEMAKQGVSGQEAEGMFSTVMQQAGLGVGLNQANTVDERTRLMAGRGDANAIARLRRAQSARLAEFQGGGGAAESQQGVTGLRSSNV